MEHKEYKQIAFTFTDIKSVDKEGKKYTQFKGYAATYGNVDRGGDRILPGAFTKSLARYAELGRPIKMFYQHDGKEILGGFPIQDVKDTSEGLMVLGEICEEVQRGREVAALMKQGVLTDMSIGYTVNDHSYDGEVRELKDLDLWEISVVGEPMNEKARIFSVKAVSGVSTLPLAPESHPWNSSTATLRVRKFTGSTEKPSAKYKRAFMYYDPAHEEEFTAYKLPYADVIDGELKAVPRAIFAIAAALHGGRGGVDIPEADKNKIASICNKYYDKLDMESPLTGKFFVPNLNVKFTLDDVLEIKDTPDFEAFLSDLGCFSRKAATYLASTFRPMKQRESVDRPVQKSRTDTLLLRELKNLHNAMR